METPAFIAGDWGTSNLRLYLCALSDTGVANVLDTVKGAGISAFGNHSNDGPNFETALFKHIQPWISSQEALPIILSGMIGSSLGWHEVPYQSCPIEASEVAQARHDFLARGHRISILGGLRTTNPLGMEDVMRGEELQLLGMLSQANVSSNDRRLVCLPGTHSKWVLLEGRRIVNFVTAVTGELFSALRQHSVLVQNHTEEQLRPNAFNAGVELAKALRGERLLHALFSTRSRQLCGDLESEEASSYLSGLLIGTDILGAQRLFTTEDMTSQTVMLIGDPHLTHPYQLAMQKIDIRTEALDPTSVALQGFTQVYAASMCETSA